jgi:hypothetical protein
LNDNKHIIGNQTGCVKQKLTEITPPKKYVLDARYWSLEVGDRRGEEYQISKTPPASLAQARAG